MLKKIRQRWAARPAGMKVKMTLLLFVIVILGFFLAIFSIYIRTADRLAQENERLLLQEMENRRDTFSATVQNLQNNILSLFYDGSIRSQLLSETAGLDDADLYNALRAYGDRFCAALPGLEGFAIYKTNGTSFQYFKSYFYTGSKDVEALPVRDYEGLLDAYAGKEIDLISACASPVWFMPDHSLQPLKNTPCFSNVYIMRDERSYKETGVVNVFVNAAWLEALCGDGRGEFSLISAAGEVLYSTKEGLLDGALSDGETLEKICGSRTSAAVFRFQTNRRPELAASVYLPELRAYLVFMPEFDVLESTQHSLAVTAVLLAALAVCYSVFAAFLFTGWLIRPISRLKETIMQARSGDLSVRYVVEAQDEIGFLGSSFNQLLDEVQTLMRNERKLEEEKRTRELRFLQEQINPHLLYNTLDSVLYFAGHGDLEMVRRIIEDCSSFFRLSLSKGEACVPLKQELEHVTYYIDLQRLCRQKDVSVEISSVPELLERPVLRMILQPIVENVFLHAFEGISHNCRILVEIAQADESGLRFTVQDNGIGMDETELETMRRRIAEERIPKNHFGLWNVRKRLQAYYGSGSRLEVESEFGEYTRVTVYVAGKEETCERPEADDCG